MQRFFRFSLIGGLVLFSGSASAPSVEAPCVVARKWAEGNPESLPTTLAGFEALPKAYRDAAYPRVAPATRASMWRERLAQFESANDLNDAQRALIRRVSARMAVYVEGGVEPGVFRGAKTAAEIRELFPSPVANALCPGGQRRSYPL